MAQTKVRTLASLKRIRARLRREAKTVVFTNGCFDLIHGGHIHLFRSAKALGDVLIVALNSDASVRRLKGPSRPVFPLAERFEVLSAIGDIDYLVPFGEDTPQKIVAALVPDILVKGGDWGPGAIVGRAEVEAAGGKVVRAPYLRGHSSTNILAKIVQGFGSGGAVPPRERKVGRGMA
jgi:D-beta-D-heptose 7-phosphate kinase/D-beta-D-heptose 1-phosphate adenosyltransferase